MQAQSPRVGPITLSERIVFIDILRGMALFGILAANMRAFFAPLDIYGDVNVIFHGRADVIVQTFIDAFIQGKFITIFSFLFGMGFAIQFSRAEARGARFLGFYPRRLVALAILGLIHGILIWGGDILLTYALAGAILLLFRKRKQKTLLWWAGSLFSLPIVIMTVFLCLYYSRFRRPWMVQKPPDLKKVQTVINIYAHGTIPQIFHQNWVEWKQMLPTQLFALYAVGLFLLGMWVWRAGIVQRLGEYKPILKRVCMWCLPAGAVISAFSAIVHAVLPPDNVSLLGFFAAISFLPGAHILAAGYISGLALIFLDDSRRRFLLPFAAIGRIALTNYLAESVLCTLFFYRYTTGLYGRIGPAWGLVPTLVLFAAQVWFSNWWLQRYRFGPVEWLWRWATYWKMPAMRKGLPESGLPVTGELAAAAAAPGAIAQPGEQQY